VVSHGNLYGSRRENGLFEAGDVLFVMHQDLRGLSLPVHREKFMKINQRYVGLTGCFIACDASGESVPFLPFQPLSRLFECLLEPGKPNVYRPRMDVYEP
jgi:hypothetical protein